MLFDRVDAVRRSAAEQVVMAARIDLDRCPARLVHHVPDACVRQPSLPSLSAGAGALSPPPPPPTDSIEAGSVLADSVADLVAADSVSDLVLLDSVADSDGSLLPPPPPLLPRSRLPRPDAVSVSAVVDSVVTCSVAATDSVIAESDRNGDRAVETAAAAVDGIDSGTRMALPPVALCKEGDCADDRLEEPRSVSDEDEPLPVFDVVQVDFMGKGEEEGEGKLTTNADGPLDRAGACGLWLRLVMLPLMRECVEGSYRSRLLALHMTQVWAQENCGGCLLLSLSWL